MSKRELLILGAIAITRATYGQEPVVVDCEDPIGQRLGWSIEKIRSSMKKDSVFRFYKSVIDYKKKTTILFFIEKGADKIGTDECTDLLSYEIKNGVAIGAWLRVKQPTNQVMWRKVVGEWVPKVGEGYMSMYASVKVIKGDCKHNKSYSLVYTPDKP